MKRIIAIDGPAGAGKSTVAKALASKLNYLYIDTGAMYRTVGLLALRNNIPFNDEVALVDATTLAKIEMKAEGDRYTVWLNGEDITDAIRTQEASAAASAVSAVSGVRRLLVKKQREMAIDKTVVMDGRDVGTVVFPRADLKIYLTASVEVRAQRRWLELQQKGEKCDLEVIKQEIADRDYRDIHRADSPLRAAEDAIIVNTDELTVEEAVEKIATMVMSD